MKIPTFEEAKQALIEKRGTPLDQFVVNWEPMPPGAEKFRETLRGLVDFVTLEAQKPRKFECLVQPDNLMNAFWNPSTERYEEKR